MELEIQNWFYKWFIGYLKDRKQFVYFDGTDSKFYLLPQGVPQSYILGP